MMIESEVGIRYVCSVNGSQKLHRILTLENLKGVKKHFEDPGAVRRTILR
jgi:hypothetical protein